MAVRPGARSGTSGRPTVDDQTEVTGHVDLTGTTVDGCLDLRGATLGLLRDDPDRWPATVLLDGLTYRTLEPVLAARQRLAWLGRDPGGYLPQPYEQLAGFYRRPGFDGNARTVLAAKQQRRQRIASRPMRGWGRLQEITVGYGYRPGRAVLWLFALILAGTVLFGAHPPAPMERAKAPEFNSLVYTIDLLLPIVDLGQEKAFRH